MFGLSMLNPWKWGTIGLAAALIVCAGWGVRVNSLRASWSAKYATLDGQAQAVLMATRQAAGDPKLAWPAVPAQITALASSNLALKQSIESTNAQVDAMAAETTKLAAAGDTLRAQLATAQAGRQSAIDKLAAMAAKPGDPKDCPANLAAAQSALDLAWSSGL